MDTFVPTDCGFLLGDDPEAPPSDATVHFRELLPKPDHPRVLGIKDHTPHSWCEHRRGLPAPAWLINKLDLKNLPRPYKGFSTDGHPDPTIFQYAEDEGAPVEAAVAAVNKLLDSLPQELKDECIKGDVETNDEFRAWSNPEFYVNPGNSLLMIFGRAVC